MSDELLKETLPWLEGAAEQMRMDILWETLEREADGDKRPVPTEEVEALESLIGRIKDALPAEDDGE